MDRVKEALFSIIGSDIQGANFLDLFAGTGSVGIEALSRGAEYALFTDLDGRAVKVVQRNLAHTGLSGRGMALRRDAFKLLAKPPDRRYQFVYVAPPQYQGMWRKTLRALDSNRSWHQAGSRIIVQVDPKEFIPAQDFAHLSVYDQRVYGSTMLVFYRFPDDAAAAATIGETAT